MQNHDWVRREEEEAAVAAGDFSDMEITGERERVRRWLQDNMKSWATPCKEATVREMENQKGEEGKEEKKIKEQKGSQTEKTTAH